MSWFESQRDAWRRVPVDDLGYLDAADLVTMSDAELRPLLDAAWTARYVGWRNQGGAWVRGLNLDAPGRTVLDFGCGLGLDAARLGLAGNRVVLADVNDDAVQLAARAMVLLGAGGAVAGLSLISGDWPYVILAGPGVDSVLFSGVLHHLPYAPSVVRRAAQLVGSGGELRAMVYGRTAVERHGADFVRAMDAVGEFADWYDADRLRSWFGAWVEVVEVAPIGDGSYLTVHMVAR